METGNNRNRAGFIFVLLCAPLVARAQNVLTYHNDSGRTGQNLNETTLTLSNVNSATFGKLFVLSVDGKVDAQPLYMAGVNTPGKGTHNLLFVATEHDSLYAFDADTGSVIWHVRTLGSAESPSDDRGCSQVTPEIGITATPAIDTASGPNGTIYVVAMSKDRHGKYHQRLHAFDLTTGQAEFPKPTEIQAQYPGTGDNSTEGFVIFDPAQYKARPGLLVLNGAVYIAWSSHCDNRPYTGWVMSYSQSTLQQQSVLNLTPNGNEGAIWQAGAGVAADAGGNLYFLMGNGTFETKLDANGFPINGDYGNAMMKLSTSGGTLAVADYFNMHNTVSESNADQDLGSGGALVLPDMTDSNGKVRHLVVGAGKDSNMYLADRDNMGKFNPNNNSNLYQELAGALPGGVFAMPAYFNGTLYYGSVGSVLQAFQFTQARLQTPASSSTDTSFTYPGTTPSISANGTLNGIVWATENTDPAVLHAYDATNLETELYNSNQAGSRDQFGSGNKFITPTIANGEVFVGTTNGVGVFGLLPVVSFSPASLNFGNQAVNHISAPQYVTLTNSGGSPLLIGSIASTESEFSLTNNCPLSPHALGAGASCTLTIRFKPNASGTRTGSIAVTDSGANSPQTVGVQGNGVVTSVTLSNTDVVFPTQLVGTTSATKSVALNNGGSSSVTISSIAISGDFVLQTAGTKPCPASGSLPAHSMCNIGFAFAPASAGMRYGAVTITDSDPSSPQIVGLSGTGTSVSLSPPSLTFSSQAVGTTSAAQTVTLSNVSGSATLHVSKISIVGMNAADFAFTSPTTCPLNGGTVPPGGSCTFSVDFTPKATGSRKASVSTSDDGGASPQKVALAGTGS